MTTQPLGRMKAGSLVVAIVMGFALLLAPLPSSFAAGLGIGLYKDGKLIQEFAPPVELADPAEEALAAAGDPSAIARKNVRTQASQVRGPSISSETQARNEIAVRAARPAAEIRNLLRAMKAGSAGLGDQNSNAGDRQARREHIRELLGEFTVAHDALRQSLSDTGARIVKQGFGPVILERHRQTLANLEQGQRNLAAAVGKFVAGDDAALDQALAAAEQFSGAAEPDLTKASPTIQVHIQQAPEMTREEADALPGKAPKVLAPAQAGVIAAASAPPTASDLAATIEVELTPEIAAKAADLGNSPLAIYEFVRNQIEFQPYLGSRKGAVETLHQLHGNDTDQASLLLALLRSAGIPCRYVRGSVEMTPERAKSWLGVDNAHTAGSILTTAGMDGVNIVNGPNVTAIRCTRVWVEAYLPYSNYRGVPRETTGKVWIPLDPAFKESVITPGQDVLAAMNFNTQAFLDNYISTFHALSPIEKLVADIQTWLGANQPGTTIQQIERIAALKPESLGLLPASLPYEVRATTSRFSELEDNKRYKVRFHLYNGGTNLIDYTTNLSQIAGRRVIIDYVGATPGDQAVITSYGGIFETPPNLVSLKPRLKINGIPLATAVNAIGMGRTHGSDLQFYQPSGASNVQPLVQNEIIAGNTQAIGFDTFLDANDSSLFGTPANSLLETLLASNAATYLNRVDRGEVQVGRIMQVVTTQDVSEAIVENAVSVTTSFGNPVTFAASGLIVDADRRIVGTFPVGGNSSKEVPYMLLTGYDGSIMENRLFEDTYGQQAVSTIKILELSNDQNIPVFRIVTSIAADAPGLSQPGSVVSAINSALAQGHIVIIPRNPITVSDWSGTGYIDLTPTTGAAGYIISGGISSGNATNGGATVVQSWSKTLACAATSVTCNVTMPSADSPALSAVFAAEDTNQLFFTVILNITCRDGTMSTVPWNFNTTATIKSIADNPAFGPGDYTLTVSALGSTPCMRKITIYKIELDEATFGGSNTDVYRDQGAQDKYPSPHWKKGRAEQSPISYPRNNSPRASAKFKVLPATFAGPFKLKADGPDSVAFPEKTVSAAAGIAEYPLTASSTNLKNEVTFYNTFDLTWRGGHASKSYTYDAMSKNRLYVTLASSAAAKLFHTVAFLACSNTGATSDTQAVAKTWALLSGPANFTTWDGQKLYYYKAGSSFSFCATTSGGLLSSTVGQCGSWMYLLKDALLANGITSQRIAITSPEPVFLVKSWTYGAASYTTTPPYNWRLRFQGTSPDMVPLPAGSVFGDLTSLSTLPGQNSAPPSEKVFARHFIVGYGGSYYDPSYGVTYAGANNFEDIAVDGYASEFPGDNPSGFTRLVLRTKHSTGLHEITFTPF